MAAQDDAPGRASVELAETELALSPGGPVDDQFEALLEEVMRPAVGAPPTCATGDRLGRYLLGRELGHGGFGVVFQARDVELNRDVAVKVLRPRAGPLGGLGIARLLREAKAMARLKHPNVVTVYEVGVSDHQPFLAMELVEGRSLRDWMRAGRRSWRQTLGVFAQAGRGLAAAHAAGLVHRDFKPDNVLVGDDRVVRVADFGLAGRSADHGLIAGGDEGPGEASADALSVAGAVAGTPLYMAPEQHRGEPPDGRTDQFSFCVALYEALHGEPPFAGRAPGDGGVAEPIGSVRPPARRNGVPRFVRAALLRGLRTAPSERFPSMDALLRAIAHEPRARRARALVAAAVLLALLAGGVLVARAREHARSQLCKGGPAQFAVAWDDSRREVLRGAFLRSGSPDADLAYRTLTRRLDDYRDRFVSAFTEACEATQLRGEQSQAVEDLRIQCLAGRANEVKALVDVLSAADRGLVEADLTGARPLPELAACADVPRLREEGSAPIDPGRFAAVQAIRAEIVKAEAYRLSQHRDQLGRAEAALAAARTLGYPPVVAEALLVFGRAAESADMPRAEQALFEAVTVALAESRFALAADAASALAIDVGRVQRYDEGRRWARLALAIVGARDLPGRVAKAHFALGLIDKMQGRFDDAGVSFTRALALRERLYGPDSVPVAEVLNSLGGIALDQNRLDEAQGYLGRALKIWDELSPTRSSISTARHNLALVEHARGREREAAALLGRYVEVARRDIPDTIVAATAMRDLATVELSLGKDDEALGLLGEALRTFELRLGPTHRDVALTLEALAEAHLHLGLFDQARGELERARAIVDAAGSDSPIRARIERSLADVARRQRRFAEAHALLDGRAAGSDAAALDVLGQTLLDEGKAEAALAVLTRAAALVEEPPGGKPAARARVALHLGEAYLALARPAEACAPLERGLAAVNEADVSPAEIARLERQLAQALWDAPADRARAVALARRGELALRDAGPRFAAERAEIGQWLASRP